LLILEKTQDDLEALFYAQEVLSKGWSRDLLLNAIKMDTKRYNPCWSMK